MAEFEGWNPGNEKGFGVEFASASFNNHNPGNLRASPFEVGKRNNFSVFVDDNVGFFAMVWDLFKKCKGETSLGLTQNSTLENLIKVYTGESQEIVSNYVSFVEQRTGFKKSMRLGDLLK
jgi:hypothetical protein